MGEAGAELKKRSAKHSVLSLLRAIFVAFRTDLGAATSSDKIAKIYRLPGAPAAAFYTTLRSSSATARHPGALHSLQWVEKRHCINQRAAEEGVFLCYSSAPPDGGSGAVGGSGSSDRRCATQAADGEDSTVRKRRLQVHPAKLKHRCAVCIHRSIAAPHPMLPTLPCQLVIPFIGGKLLLGRKLRGFGEGYWNGFGGEAV